ncbi:ice-binding family protein [Cryobacterium sp. Y57]|uniref:ice-binding family protein n=1 Tax=Cryobacterium sp. Y57 TaxID=2048287 RepID=UPI0018ED5D4F|nr:ice-binding family protein [Cryobacterium sp. Y57]
MSAVLLAGMQSVPPPAYAAEAPVGLGTVGTYAVLGGQAVTNTGSSVLGGDLGVSPGTSIPGFPPGLYRGTKHAADAQAAQAQSDLLIAYDDAAGRAPTAGVADDLVGRTLTAGVYKSTGPLALSGTLTLDGQGDPNAVFIFQIASTLITASASSVTILNGAQACNVYWQVGTSATLGTASSFKGTIMALTSIAVNTSTVVEGRALARNGEVTLNNNVFTMPGCNTGTETAPDTETAPTGAVAGTGADTAPGTETAPTGAVAGTDAEAAPGTETAPTGAVAGTEFHLAATGVSPLLSRQLALGAVLLILGGLLLVVGRARKRSGGLRQSE